MKLKQSLYQNSNFSSRTHYHHEDLDPVLIIKPMGLLIVDLLTSWYYNINQKIIEKSQHIKIAK